MWVNRKPVKIRLARHKIGLAISLKSCFSGLHGGVFWNKAGGSVIHKYRKIGRCTCLGTHKSRRARRHHRLSYVMQSSDSDIRFYRIRLRPVMREITKSTTKMKNSTFAIEAAASTIPKNPKIPATSAIIRNMTDHFNMRIHPFVLKFVA